MEEKQQQQNKGFDLTVTFRDSKTGVVTHSDPYTLTIIQSENGRVKLFERPPGSGNLFNKKGEPVGRWEKDEDGKKVYNAKAKHLDYQKPLTLDQKLAKQVLEKDAEIASLKKALAEKERAAIEAESKAESEEETKAESKGDAKSVGKKK